MTESGVPQEPQRAERPKSKFSTFLSHPTVAVINLIAAIIGLIGLPLSFYFYYAAKESPQLLYYVSPAKAVVVKAGQASKLTASYDNRVITTDITAAQVAIWNAGNKAIKRESILQPITIYTENNTPILEATVRKTSRQIVGLELNPDEIQRGRLTVSWNILEENDGGVVQLIYAGSPEVQIQAEGVIEGQQQIVRSGGEILPVPEMKPVRFSVIRIVLLTTPIVAWLFVFIMYRRQRSKSLSKRQLFDYSFLITASVLYPILFVVLLFLTYYWQPVTPPFVFS